MADEMEQVTVVPKPWRPAEQTASYVFSGGYVTRVCGLRRIGSGPRSSFREPPRNGSSRKAHRQSTTRSPKMTGFKELSDAGLPPTVQRICDPNAVVIAVRDLSQQGVWRKNSKNSEIDGFRSTGLKA
jgi:hypothetical protein